MAHVGPVSPSARAAALPGPGSWSGIASWGSQRFSGRSGVRLTAVSLRRRAIRSAGERGDRRSRDAGISKLAKIGGIRSGNGIATSAERLRIPVAVHSETSKIVRRGSKAPLYEDADSYVLMEPGQDEQFVTQEELLARLKAWLVKWPASQLPEDLTQFDSMDEVASYLVDSACELNLGGGLGSIQWFQVRLEA